MYSGGSNYRKSLVVDCCCGNLLSVHENCAVAQRYQSFSLFLLAVTLVLMAVPNEYLVHRVSGIGTKKHNVFANRDTCRKFGL